MVRLEDIRPKSVILGLDPHEVATVSFVEPIGDGLTVYYKLSDGKLRERLVQRHEESTLSFPQSGLPWAFNADGAKFKLVAEAYRINLAYLFDPMMAVHTSNVDPLPHQITAVYESMLPRQPLRYVLADDPGAGKTIMAGLLIRELMMRADAYRIMIVAPGSLVEQWQDELMEKFGLRFEILTNEMVESLATGNPFEERNHLIARVDQLARRDDFLEKLDRSRWDLIVVDEAHKLSAHYSGSSISKTDRFELGERLGAVTRHFLLMTATPHNVKDADFQLFLSLLDSDRFYGRFRDGIHQVETSDIMRRMTKEQLVKFDGTPLFPERRAYTVNYKLSDMELKLYDKVTAYVKTEMGKAEALLDGKRGKSVGFALTALQRRLASSPFAICRSLERRSRRLKDRLEQSKVARRSELLSEQVRVEIPDDEDASAAELEVNEDAILAASTVAETVLELEAELVLLDDLVSDARALVASNKDMKWTRLSEVLGEREMFRSAGQRRKLIIFTEHRDTLDYLKGKIGALWGDESAVVMIHGGIKRDERRKVQESFRNDPSVVVLLATDAAGEGVNLQNANLMVNYDLPWNPNRLEQRFGRIHRIGQTEVCHLWNLVASETREGEVFRRLLDKLQEARNRLDGRVFDVLGEIFEGNSLRDMLVEAIRYGDRPEIREKLRKRIEGALDFDHVAGIIRRHALCADIMDADRLFAVKEKMEEAEARRLQPYFIQAFFREALTRLGGELRERESGRYEIPRVPPVLIEADRRLSGRDRRYLQPITSKYERICFEKQHLRVPEKPTAPLAALVHAAHPLMHAATDLMLEYHRPLLRQGAILADHTDHGRTPRLLLLIDHAVKEGVSPDRDASRTFRFVSVSPTGETSFAGWAPHLDLTPVESVDLALLEPLLQSEWLAQDHESRALDYATRHIASEHYEETRSRRQAQVNKTLDAVHERLVREIQHWEERVSRYDDESAAGKDVRLNRDKALAELRKLEARLEARSKELKGSLHLTSTVPRVVGCALVVPAGLLAEYRGEPSPADSIDAVARAQIERIAMDAVRRVEEARGHRVVDVSSHKCGWDLSAYPPNEPTGQPPTRHIEVKGRRKGATTVTVTKNEVIEALNQGDKFRLAIVLVDESGAIDGPHYLRAPFSQQPDWATTSINLDMAELLKVASFDA